MKERIVDIYYLQPTTTEEWTHSNTRHPTHPSTPTQRWTDFGTPTANRNSWRFKLQNCLAQLLHEDQQLCETYQTTNTYWYNQQVLTLLDSSRGYWVMTHFETKVLSDVRCPLDIEEEVWRKLSIPITCVMKVPNILRWRDHTLDDY